MFEFMRQKTKKHRGWYCCEAGNQGNLWSCYTGLGKCQTTAGLHVPKAKWHKTCKICRLCRFCRSRGYESCFFFN